MYKLKESNIEQGITSTKSSKKYDLFILFLLSILQLFLHSNSSAYPILFKQPKFLCKNEADLKFTKKCSTQVVCNNMKKGIDFIIDPISLDSLIYELELYCKPTKVSILESAIFAGPSLSILLTPFLINNFGPVRTLKMCGFVYVILLVILQLAKSFLLLTLAFYGVFFCTYTMYNCKSIYIVEMCDPKKRSLFYGILNVNSGFAGIFVVVVIQYTNNIKNCFFINMIAIMFVLCLVHLYMVESVRFLYMNRKFDQIVQNLKKISLFNGKNQSKFEDWLETVKVNKNEEDFDSFNSKEMVTFETNESDHLHKKNEENQEISKDEMKKINFISILKFKSQFKTLMIFTFIIFVIKFSNVFLLLELGHTKTTKSMILFFIVDSITNVCSAILIEKPNIGRKKFTFFIMIFCGLGFLLTSLWYKYFKYSFVINLVNRVFVAGGLTVIILFNFESYPTLTRATSSSFNKFFGMFFNIFTPYFITNFRDYMYIFIGTLFLVGAVLTLKLQETQGRKLQEYPIEYKEFKDNLKSKEVKQG